MLGPRYCTQVISLDSSGMELALIPWSVPQSGRSRQSSGALLASRKAAPAPSAGGVCCFVSELSGFLSRKEHLLSSHIFSRVPEFRRTKTNPRAPHCTPLVPPSLALPSQAQPGPGPQTGSEGAITTREVWQVRPQTLFLLQSPQTWDRKSVGLPQ
jgi:hypothetical protein